MTKPLLEIACFHAESARIAADCGADRIELCRDKPSDGLTPFIDTLEEVLQSVNIPIRVMIRPRAGNFVYSETEITQMRDEMMALKNYPIEGFVFGCLLENNQIDLVQNKILCQLAEPFKCTFHKAFDNCNQQETALKHLIDLGFDTVLTSGGMPTAMEGIDKLKHLNVLAQGKINILVGGSVRSVQLEELRNRSGLNQFHSSAITKGNELADAQEVLNLKKILST